MMMRHKGISKDNNSKESKITSPPHLLTPKYLGCESFLLAVEPPAFFVAHRCAILYTLRMDMLVEVVEEKAGIEESLVLLHP